MRWQAGEEREQRTETAGLSVADMLWLPSGPSFEKPTTAFQTEPMPVKVLCGVVGVAGEIGGSRVMPVTGYAVCHASRPDPLNPSKPEHGPRDP